MQWVKKSHLVFNIFSAQSQSISPRIVGGVNAADGQAPFQCYIHDEDFGYVCGCAVVAAEWIITAAHCLEE